MKVGDKAVLIRDTYLAKKGVRVQILDIKERQNGGKLCKVEIYDGPNMGVTRLSLVDVCDLKPANF